MSIEKIEVAALEYAKKELGEAQFNNNQSAVNAICHYFKKGALWRQDVMKLPEGKIMTDQELNDKMDQILKENNMDWQQIHLWISRKGYVIITEEQYENMEVIDQDGPCP